MLKKLANYRAKYANWFSVLFCRFALNSTPRVIAVRNGPKIRTNRELAVLQIVDDIFFCRIYEQHGLSIGSNDVVADIGGNIGVFSLYAAAKTGNSVYSYEPFEKNYETIKENARINGFDMMKPHHTAVADKDGSSKLFLSDINAGHLLFDHNDAKGLTNYLVVKTTTLKSIIDETGPIDFLKVDCEGSEGAIFTSTPKEYLAKIRQIALEFHDNVSSLKHDEIAGLLRGAGFTTFVDWDGTSPFGYLYASRRPLV